MKIDMGPAKGPEGAWVLMDGDKIIATSMSAEEIFKIAEKYPDDERYKVAKILYPNASFF
ncbi:MAG: hypothetical protein JSV49_07560 [Thermoplasmata archaeon]|nr:MAG: hypothetical protein JSV49_07560 [Thermoplasmata archaeon]